MNIKHKTFYFIFPLAAALTRVPFCSVVATAQVKAPYGRPQKSHLGSWLSRAALLVEQPPLCTNYFCRYSLCNPLL